MSDPYLALTPDQLHQVLAVLRAFAPAHQALAFGSRVRFEADRHPVKPHADLDIALAGKPMPIQDMFMLRDAFSESDLPFRVDVAMQEDLPAHWLEAMTWLPLSSHS